ncbi:MAG TPA: hypothetical protein VHS59_06285, partial [Bacillota bacterium]|nr:hypothetical protein [Bacillota bacterium]
NKSLTAYSAGELKNLKTALNRKVSISESQLKKEIYFYMPVTNDWRKEIAVQVNEAIREADNYSILNIKIQ